MEITRVIFEGNNIHVCLTKEELQNEDQKEVLKKCLSELGIETL